MPWQLMVASCVATAGVGLNSLMRSMGTTIAGAVMAVVLTSQTVTLAPGTTPIPSQGAFQLCFVIGAAAAALGALVVLLVPRRGAADDGPTDEPARESVRDADDEGVLVG